MAAVFTLTVRQLAGSRRWWLVLGLVALPLLAACSSRRGEHDHPAEYADDITAVLVASAILPLVVLLLGTAALGNEVGDRTLVYLTAKPLPRWRIVLPKLLAALLVGGVPVALSGALAVAIIAEGDVHGAVATGAGLLGRGCGVRGGIHLGWPRHAPCARDRARVRVRGKRRSLPTWTACGTSACGASRSALTHALDADRLATTDITLGAGAGIVGVTLVVAGFAVSRCGG